MNSKLVQILRQAQQQSDIQGLKAEVMSFEISSSTDPLVSRGLNQILESQTIDRAKHYVHRLLQSETQPKTVAYNDINLNRWKEYDAVWTDSLWQIPKRDRTGVHQGDYWGNFVPQIPQQLLTRYTQKGDWVLDPFLGSGTTLIECQNLGRHGVGIDIYQEAIDLAKQRVHHTPNLDQVTIQFIQGNSADKNTYSMVGEVDFVMLHPPYWDIISFGQKPEDLSGFTQLEDFLEKWSQVVKHSASCLKSGRFLAVVIGDRYQNGEWIPLGFYCMQAVLKLGMTLKSTIVKNFDQTKGKRNQEALWRYRALAGGFYVFKHEYIFIFQKD